ncbi:FMN-binding negative transcriptional regulator [Hyphomonas sp.]|uniref:FMN-binding negative transcriptional regulator n=1 Tax=Hyphomonas sp. TaxID=87 RepID=UPI00391AFC06
MHPAPIFREADTDALLARIRAYPLGLITLNGGPAPLAAHSPVLAARLDDGSVRLRFHLSAGNPMTHRLEAGAAALIVFTGPEAYISPDWYGPVPDQVPTWNYLSAEAEGTVVPTDAEAFLDDVSAEFEARLLPKPTWTRSKMDPAAFARMVRAIRAFEMVPHRFEGITKLSQNKTPDMRAGVMDALGEHPIAAAMRRSER